MNELQGNVVDVIHLDFQKEFNKVHHRLMNKVRVGGVTGKVEQWIASWLQDRKLRVGVKCSYSDRQRVGSVFHKHQYWDHCCSQYTLMIWNRKSTVQFQNLRIPNWGGIVSTEEDCNKLQQDINKLADGALKWQVHFNVEMCAMVHFGRRNKEVIYILENKNLNRVEEQKRLEVHIHNSLKVATQVNKAIKKKEGQVWGSFLKGKK